MHWISADAFFICLLVFSALISKLLRDLHQWNPTCICKRSLVVKTVMSLYLFAVGFYYSGYSRIARAKIRSGRMRTGLRPSGT
jgi:hypothetical protein